jgi:hypothetical protein
MRGLEPTITAHEPGLMGGDCGVKTVLVGTECEPKTFLVCRLGHGCLQAATPRYCRLVDNPDLARLPGYITNIYVTFVFIVQAGECLADVLMSTSAIDDRRGIDRG